MSGAKANKQSVLLEAVIYFLEVGELPQVIKDKLASVGVTVKEFEDATEPYRRYQSE